MNTSVCELGRVHPGQNEKVRPSKSVAMAAPAEIDISALVLQNVVTTSRGAKQILLSRTDGKPSVWQPKDSLQPAFEASAFGDDNATRVNLVFNPTDEVCAQLARFDTWCKAELTKESARLFGQTLSAEEVERRYQSALRRSEKNGMLSFRVKMNKEGRSAVRCWDTFRQSRAQPTSWVACSVIPRLALRSLWVMNKEVGPVFELTDALIDEASMECPF